MIGSTVSHYRILEKIGEGGMGEVYLAEDTKLKRQVSLKFLSANLTRDEERKQRFIQEARAAAAIQHPHIAAVYDIDESEGRTFIAMEYIPGESLREVIESKTLSLRRSLELGFQVADGLAKAHEKGVVHRDMKPENVLVSEDGYAKIIDFGLAKLLEPSIQDSESSEETATKLKTKEGLVMGTVAYMSPEQARGKAVDARSDIFSFGALLHEMVSGEGPFRRASAVESLNAVIKESPSPITLQGMETPAELQRILRKALAKEPADRYQSMKDLALDLRELREDIGSSVSRPAVAAAAPAAGRPKWLWGAVAAGALGLLALAFYLGTRQPSTPPGIGASGRPAIAVMYFESLSGDEEVRWLSKGLPNMLITDLAQTPGLDVVSSQRIHQILTEIGQEDLDTIDKSLVPEIAERAGAGAVVLGSIFKSGSEIRLDVQVLDVVSGRVLSAESVRGDDVFPLVDELTDRIRASLDLGDRPAGRPIAEVTTPSLEAFQLYSEGLVARRNLRLEDARKLFEEAAHIDSSFAMAYFGLWGIARRLGETNLGDQYREKVLKHLDRLPERQKLLVQATAHRVQGKSEEAENILEDLLARYPDEEEAYRQLWQVYNGLNQPEKALATVERAVKAIPRSGPLRNNYGYFLLQRARYAEGIREFETYAQLNPKEPNPHDSLGEAYLFTGQPEKALEKYAHALEVDPSFGVSHVSRAWAFGMLGRYDDAFAEMGEARKSHKVIGQTALLSMDAFTLSQVGRFREAEERLREAAALALEQGNIAARVDAELLHTVLELETGNASDVITRIRRTQESIPQVNPVGFRNDQAMVGHLLAGIAEVQRENLEAARAHLDSQSKIYRPQLDWDVWMYHTLQGEIALAAGDLAAAESAFLAGEPEFKMFFGMHASTWNVFVNNLTFRDGLARVKKAQGDLAGAIRIYRKLNTPDIGAKYTAMLEPRFVLETARLLDEMGDKEGARAEYERFLELWKDADEGLPELEEARKYVGT